MAPETGDGIIGGTLSIYTYFNATLNMVFNPEENAEAAKELRREGNQAVEEALNVESFE